MVTKLSSGKRKAFYVNCLKYINLSETVVNLNYIAALLLLYIWIHFNFGFKFWFFWFQLRDATKKHNQPKRRIKSVRLFFEKRNPSSSWPIPPDWKRQVNNFIFSAHSYTILSYSYQPRFIWRFKIFGRRINNFYTLKQSRNIVISASIKSKKSFFEALNRLDDRLTFSPV